MAHDQIERQAGPWIEVGLDDRAMNIPKFVAIRCRCDPTTGHLVNRGRTTRLRRALFQTVGIVLANTLLGVADVRAEPLSSSTNSAERKSSSLKSMVDFRDENLVRQQFDYSCGAAALATLLRFGFGEAITERQIVDDLFAGLEQAAAATREKEGFSLFDLQQVAQRRGFKAEGFQLEPQYLAQLNGPVIVFLETMGYKHFAVLKGVRGDRVYLADPSRGNIRIPAYRFLQAWMRNGAGIVFVVEPRDAKPGRMNVLRPSSSGMTQPEIIGVRELLAVRAPFAR